MTAGEVDRDTPPPEPVVSVYSSQLGLWSNFKKIFRKSFFLLSKQTASVYLSSDIMKGDLLVLPKRFLNPAQNELVSVPSQ